MDDFNVIYDYSSSDENSINSDNYKTIRDIIKDKYYNIIINSIDRDWANLYKNTFSFNIKFGNNNERINKEYSSSISIPIVIKNIFNIEIYKIQLPSRFIDIGNSNFVNIADLNGISLVIEELNNICYGSNNILNNSFGNFLQITPIPKLYIANFIEYKNINPYGKFFYPAPINTLNTLTFKMYDLDGMELKYNNDRLTIKNMVYNENTITIILNESMEINMNYIVGDIIIFQKLNTNSIELNSFLKENNHIIKTVVDGSNIIIKFAKNDNIDFTKIIPQNKIKIKITENNYQYEINSLYFYKEYIKIIIDNNINTGNITEVSFIDLGINNKIIKTYLEGNVFYKLDEQNLFKDDNDYKPNNTNIIYIDNPKKYDSMEFNLYNDNLGYLLNKNLQLKLFMNIKTKEKEVLSHIELI